MMTARLEALTMPRRGDGMQSGRVPDVKGHGYEHCRSREETAPSPVLLGMA
jgi:hypothetical protein